MAEAAGLVLGGVALVALIQTCVEFLEYFEDCRNCIRDVHIAVTKVKLMKVRLDQLGSFGHPPVQRSLIDPSTEITHHDWHHVSSSLPDGASVIQGIIKETTHLCRRYSYDGFSGTSISRKCTQMAHTPSHQRSDSSGESPRLGRRAVLHTVTRSVSWAFHDKKKFDGLINDFDFILSNLEKIIKGFQVKETGPYRRTVAMADQSNQSKKMNAPQGRGAWVFGEVHQSNAPGGVRYEGNDSKDQSLHFVGVRVDVHEEHMAILRGNNSNHPSAHPLQVNRQEQHGNTPGATTTTYSNNVSHDQSMAVTGAINSKDIQGLGALWKENAMETIRLNLQANALVRGAQAELTIIETSKLTEKTGEPKAEGGETKGEA